MYSPPSSLLMGITPLPCVTIVVWNRWGGFAPFPQMVGSFGLMGFVAVPSGFPLGPRSRVGWSQCGLCLDIFLVVWISAVGVREGSLALAASADPGSQTPPRGLGILEYLNQRGRWALRGLVATRQS